MSDELAKARADRDLETARANSIAMRFHTMKEIARELASMSIGLAKLAGADDATLVRIAADIEAT